MADAFFDAEPGTLRCSCPCGCQNTNADAGMFSNATEAFLTSDYSQVGECVCEMCFCGDWPDACGKLTYEPFEEIWRRVKAEQARAND